MMMLQFKIRSRLIGINTFFKRELSCLKVERQVKTHPLLPVSSPSNLKCIPESSLLTPPVTQSHSASLQGCPPPQRWTEEREMKAWHVPAQGCCLLGNALCSTMEVRTSNARSLTRKWHTRGLDSSDGVRLTSRRLQKGHLWNKLVHGHPLREEYCFYSDQRVFFSRENVFKIIMIV